MNDEFDFGESLRRKEEGIKLAASSKNGMLWKHDAGRWFMLLPVGTCFTTDDVIKAVGPPGEGVNTCNVVGAWFNGLAKSRFIRRTGRTFRSERVVRHAGITYEWIKLR